MVTDKGGGDVMVGNRKIDQFSGHIPEMESMHNLIGGDSMQEPIVSML